MIPCFISTLNLLTWTQAIAEQCTRLGLRPVVVDLGSTFPPLLEWLANCPHETIRLDRGAKTPINWFLSPEFARHLPRDWYCVTDPDLDLAEIPGDCVARLQAAFEENRDVRKAGVSLETNDIPDHLPLAASIRRRENRFWIRRRQPGVWRANVASTFAIYHSDRTTGSFYSGVRLDRPYTARHRPWYLSASDYANDAELSYYVAHATNPRAFWTGRQRKLIELE